MKQIAPSDGGANPRDRTQEVQHVSVPLRARRVLVVEDDDANVVTFSDFLRAHAFDVAVATDGRKGIALARELRPDVIVMDVQMPEMDGFEVMRAIRSDACPRLRVTPIFAVTALAMPGDRERCIAAGADEYWPKPVSLRLLTAAIARRVSQQIYVDSVRNPGTS